MNKTPLPQYTRVALNSSLAKENVELATFYAFAGKTIPEVALTEFAARVCYNSTGKLGSVPKFVQNVLSHGHLSVAEHASLAIKVSGANAKGIQKYNRFFTTASPYIAGNMRSWIEFLAAVPYKETYEILLSVFPPAFANDPILSLQNPKTVAPTMPFNVPSFNGTHLLGVNYGDIIAGTFKRNEGASWGRFTFLLEGMSRACSHQIARHRGASISEQSLRYVDAKDAEFVYPPDATEIQVNELKCAYQCSFDAYVALRKYGMKKEDARFALPLATKTRMVVSFDKKELLHFLNVRCAKDAQWEVRNFAERMAVQAMLATDGAENFVEVVKRFGLEGKFGRETEG